MCVCFLPFLTLLGCLLKDFGPSVIVKTLNLRLVEMSRFSVFNLFVSVTFVLSKRMLLHNPG